MKNSVLLIIILALFQQARAQSQAGLEQYVYFGKNQNLSLVTVGYYQNAHGWYGELRYNYEEEKTFSIYAGKTFNGGNQLSYTVTPLLGLLVGQFKGGSIGTNLNVSFKKIDLSAQIQYIVSMDDRDKNFVLNWSELSYQLLPYMKSGLVVQQSAGFRSALNTESGVFVSFSYKNWELPIYAFSPYDAKRNYVVGISWQWQHNRTGKAQGPLPSLRGKRTSGAE